MAATQALQGQSSIHRAEMPPDHYHIPGPTKPLVVGEVMGRALAATCSSRRRRII